MQNVLFSISNQNKTPLWTHTLLENCIRVWPYFPKETALVKLITDSVESRHHSWFLTTSTSSLWFWWSCAPDHHHSMYKEPHFPCFPHSPGCPLRWTLACRILRKDWGSRIGQWETWTCSTDSWQPQWTSLGVEPELPWLGWHTVDLHLHHSWLGVAQQGQLPRGRLCMDSVLSPRRGI